MVMVHPESTCDCVYDHSSDNYEAETASVASSSEYCNNELVVEDSFGKYEPSIGNISVTNCNDIHFGNKTFYQGPVTIKQCVYTANGKLPNSEGVISDNDNNSEQKISVSTDNVTVPNDLNNKVNSANFTTKDKTEFSKSKKGVGWLHDLPRKHVIVVISLSIVLITSLIISTTILLTRNSISVTNGMTSPSDGLEQEETDVGISKDNGSFVLPGKLKIIARAEWVAQPPTEPLPPLRTPVPYVIIMHTATETCTDEPTCIFHVRHIQMYHIESRKWWDIGYNYLVGGDGFAYEGRGWKSEGAHTYGYNVRSIGIALIGTFTNVLPQPRQITATKQLIQKGVELGYIAKDYKLLAARQLQSTESPGKLFFEELKTWSHWAETP